MNTLHAPRTCFIRRIQRNRSRFLRSSTHLVCQASQEPTSVEIHPQNAAEIPGFYKSRIRYYIVNILLLAKSLMLLILLVTMKVRKELLVAPCVSKEAFIKSPASATNLRPLQDTHVEPVAVSIGWHRLPSSSKFSHSRRN